MCVVARYRLRSRCHFEPTFLFPEIMRHLNKGVAPSAIEVAQIMEKIANKSRVPAHSFLFTGTALPLCALGNSFLRMQVDVITWAQFREAMLSWMAPAGDDTKKRTMGADDSSVRVAWV